ncbi:MAG: hypothetical protein QUS35_03545 [bacterium]|nr:hypothetical protein [bacterium]
MNVSYRAPLERAWKRMTQALFRPFDLRKWLVMGFTAFLAGLMDWQGGRSGRSGHSFDGRDWRDILEMPAEAWDWLTGHPLWAALIFAGVIAVIVLSVVLTWLSSRGKFMFLDNVFRDRAAVRAPWREFRSAGDSLFVARLLLGAVAFAVFSIYLLGCLLVLIGMAGSDASRDGILPTVLIMAAGLLLLILAAAFMDICLNDFVVPVMAKRRMTILPAAGVFWNLFRRDPGAFLLYGLLIFLLKAAVVALLVAVGLMTCCVGFLLLAVPYVNSVILLPVSYGFRAFSLEFLRQFGPGFDLLGAKGKAARKPVPRRTAASGKPVRGNASGKKR